MSKELEQVFRLLTENQESSIEQAKQLAHEYMVKRAKQVYQTCIAEDFATDDETAVIEPESFVDAVSADIDNVEADELNDGEAEIEDETSLEDEDVSDQLQDLSSQLEELRDMFNKLVSAEKEEPEHSDDDFDFVDADDAETEDKDKVSEATDFTTAVPSVEKTEKSTGPKDSPLSKSPGKKVAANGAAPVKFAKPASDKVAAAKAAQGDTPDGCATDGDKVSVKAGDNKLKSGTDKSPVASK